MMLAEMFEEDQSSVQTASDQIESDDTEASDVEAAKDLTSSNDPKTAANEAKPLALKWIDNAILMLNSCIRSVDHESPINFQAKIGFPIVRLHFHTDRPERGSTEMESLKRVESNYQKIRRFLCNSENIFYSADDETASLNTLGYFQPDGPLVGGYAYAMKSVSFTNHYLTLGPKCRASVIIHELGHYIDPRILHLGGESGYAYDNSDFETAINNVHCYQNFAIHATPPYLDERYGMNRPEV